MFVYSLEEQLLTGNGGYRKVVHHTGVLDLVPLFSVSDQCLFKLLVLQLIHLIILIKIKL